MPDDQLIRDVSDTARWVAVFRAEESERRDALFRDPFARRLAGARGEEIFRAMRSQKRQSWAYAVRTYLFDSFVGERVEAGADVVVNLAAGLDARPYRLDLPPALRWIEVDLPELLAYKESILSGEKPKCQLERVALDLSDLKARRALFERIGAESQRALILSEGLLIYLTAGAAAELATDLAAQSSFAWWAIDIVSPGLFKMLNRQVGGVLEQANAPLQFAPEEGPWFFEPYGWRVRDVRGSFKTAGRLRRVPLLMRLFAMLPENPRAGKRPWAGICLLENASDRSSPPLDSKERA